MLIGSHRHLFDIPSGIAYFNTAYNAPLLRSSREALERAAGAKCRPWERSADEFFEDAEAVRTLSAELFGASADDYAIIPAASYGISAAARILESHLGKGDRIVLLAQEFPSNVLPWRRVAQLQGAEIVTVRPSAPDDLTSGILATLGKGVKVVTLPACQWTDGALIDLAAIGEACRSIGAALVLDLTQSLGAMPFDLDAVQPDFMVAAGYKWLLGPYGFGIMYVAPRWQGERPLEETWLARTNARDFARLVDYCDDYRPGARRFDVGETCVTTVLPGALSALRQLQEWGIGAIQAQLAAINREILSAAEAAGHAAPARGARCGHILGLACHGDIDGTIERLVAGQVFVSRRGDALRIAPHLHNVPDDVDRLIEALKY